MDNIQNLVNKLKINNDDFTKDKDLLITDVNLL